MSASVEWKVCCWDVAERIHGERIMRRYLQHYFNALHVFCIMRRVGFDKGLSMALARRWERTFHRIIY